MSCKNVKIENETIICKKYQAVPEEIENGTKRCKYHERININSNIQKI